MTGHCCKFFGKFSWVLASCILVGASLQAQPIAFFDETFNRGDWTALEVEDSTAFGSGTFSVRQQSEGGNPGFYREVKHDFSLGRIGVAHLKEGAIYDPATQGPVCSIQYRYDLNHFNPPSVVAHVEYGLLLFQNGSYYRTRDVDFVIREGWQTFSRQNLAADDFVRVLGPGPMEPDFSVRGAPIQFGFITRNLTDQQAQSRTSGIDNWSVTLQPTALFAVSSASFALGAPLAPQMIASGFGVGLAPGEAAATTTPLPTRLLETGVDVIDSQGVSRAAPLYYVGPGQINFLVPRDTALGRGFVLINSDEVCRGIGEIQIEEVAPSLYTINAQGTGLAAALALRVEPNGARTEQFVYDVNTLAPVPIDLGPSGDEVYLILFGTGIRGFTSGVNATVGGVAAPAVAAPHGRFVGLDQVNVGPLPRNLIGRGQVNVVLTVDGKTANTVSVNIR